MDAAGRTTGHRIEPTRRPVHIKPTDSPGAKSHSLDGSNQESRDCRKGTGPVLSTAAGAGRLEWMPSFQLGSLRDGAADF